ncbi:MAG: polyprenyl synthetase family protein [Micrococcaceae bacterium]
MAKKGFGLDNIDAELGAELLNTMQKVEQRLDEVLTQKDFFTNQTSKHLMKAGGKRVRPMLTILSSKFGATDFNEQDVIDAAVAVELTHLASLYHDDVMDSAELRRGTETAHVLWGNNAAILTGDILFAKASIIVSALGSEALGLQSRTFERLCLGQLHETIGPQGDEDPHEHYLQVISDKTSSLIAMASEFGAMFSGVDKDAREILRQYGEKVGTAFQLADDIIDVTSTKKQSGKNIGTDLREGVPTLPTLLLRKADDKTAIAAIDADLSSDEALQEAIEVLANHEVTKQAWDIAYQWANDARDILAPLPDNAAKQALQDFAIAVVERDT